MSEHEDHDRNPRDITSVERRALLRGAAGLTVAGLSLAVGRAAQAQATSQVEVLMNNAMVSPPLKAILEKQLDLKIVDAPFMSGTDTVSRLSAPGGARFDLMNSSFAFSQPVVMGAKAGSERVQPIDLSQIPNMKYINDVSKRGIGQRDGKTYMIPHSWGYDSIIYNRKAVPDDDPYTQSWSLLFEDKYAGRIGWWDVAHQMLMAAGLYLGHKEPEKMDRAQLTEVGAFLIKKKKNVRTFFGTFAQGSNLLSGGEIDVCYGIAPMRNDLQKRGFDVAGAWPKEGVLSLINASYIPKEARNTKAAHALINAMLDKPYAQALASGSGYLSSSTFAMEGLSEADKKKYGFGIFDGSIRHYELKFPTNMNMWIETWSRVKSS